MTKNERIAELERRVTELESQLARQFYAPSMPTSTRCSWCGTYYTGLHSCWAYPYPTLGGTYVSAAGDQHEAWNIHLGGDNCVGKVRAGYG